MNFLQVIYDSIDPVAFSIGSIHVHWYGILFILSFFLAALVLYTITRRWNLDFTSDDLLVLIIAGILGAIIGARIAYVCFYGGGYYAQYPLKVFALNEGGLSFHGGLVGGIIAAVIASRILHMPLLSILDLVFIVAPIGICLVRCANFINGELWGEVSDVSWAVVFGGSAGESPRHPSQLYEAFLEGVCIFIVQFLLSFKKPPLPRGSFTGIFLILYAIARISVENVRVPDAQLGYLLGTDWLTMGMILSIPLLCAGAILIFYAIWTRHAQEGCTR